MDYLSGTNFESLQVHFRRILKLMKLTEVKMRKEGRQKLEVRIVVQEAERGEAETM